MNKLLPIKIQKLDLPDKVEEDFVVVIDVIRAFTTAAYAFAQGVDKIILVSSVEEAFSLKKNNPEYLLMGEVGGIPIHGFDYGNSPVEISKVNLQGKTLIQRTSAGTQGVVRSVKSKKLLVSSFVVADATLKRIRYLHPNLVTFVITGNTDGDEDRSLADYLEQLILQKTENSKTYLQRVVDSPEGKIFSSPELPLFPKEDLDAVLKINNFPFSMEVFNEAGFPVLHATNFDGSLWSLSCNPNSEN
jgi:2-phosphosulfolactate phosphatase